MLPLIIPAITAATTATAAGVGTATLGAGAAAAGTAAAGAGAGAGAGLGAAAIQAGGSITSTALQNRQQGQQQQGYPERPERRRLQKFIQILEDFQLKERERFSRGQALLTQLAMANMNVAGLYA